MGFKEGILVLVFIAIAAPFAFKLTSKIPGFQDEAILAVMFLFYSIDAFMSRSPNYFPAAAIQQLGGIRDTQIRAAAMQQQASKQVAKSAARPRGLAPASSFSFRRR